MAAGGSGTGGAGMGGAGAAAGAGATAGAASGGTAGAAGGAAGTSSGGSGGSAGGGGGVGGSSGGMGGSMDCAGHAVSFSANGTGTASDSAAAIVQIDLKSDLPLGNANRTVEFWAYMKDSDWTANTNTLFFYGTTMRQGYGFGLDFGSKQGSIGTIDPFTNSDSLDNDNQASGVTTTSAQWVHFAMTWNGTAVQAYVNGALKSTKTSSSEPMLTTATSAFTLGGYPAEKAYFAGLIDELRIWSVARSASDIMGTMKKTLVGNEAGLVGYWQFNEASGTTAADAVTTAGHTAHNGTLMAASAAQNPTFVLPTPPSPVSCP